MRPKTPAGGRARRSSAARRLLLGALVLGLAGAVAAILLDGPARRHRSELRRLREARRSRPADPQASAAAGRGRDLFDRRGCRGCHKIARTGGELGEDLSTIGADGWAVAELAAINGETSPWNRFTWHLDQPLAATPGYGLPPLGAKAVELNDLTAYLLSLRPGTRPAEALPTDGPGLYTTLCSACHGDDGLGRDWSSRGLATPAIRSPAFLERTSRRFAAATIARGRDLRGMPSWRRETGGLSQREIGTLVEWLWAARPAARPLSELMTIPPDRRRGQEIYARACAGCHGADGHGGDFGHSLRAPAFRARADLGTLYAMLVAGWPDAGMPGYGSLPAEDLRHLLALLEDWGPASPPRPDLRPAAGDAAAGARRYASDCAGCHGPHGSGASGPALNSHEYLGSVSDGYLRLAIADHARAATGGMDVTPVRALDPAAVEDLVAGLRGWTGSEPWTPTAPPASADQRARGQELYQELCARCHGWEGQGRSAIALGSRALHGSATGAQLVMSVLVGRPGTAMPAWMLHPERPLAPSEARAIVAWLRQLDLTPAGRKP